jgi:hypothetical protein
MWSPKLALGSPAYTLEKPTSALQELIGQGGRIQSCAYQKQDQKCDRGLASKPEEYDLLDRAQEPKYRD